MTNQNKAAWRTHATPATDAAPSDAGLTTASTGARDGTVASKFTVWIRNEQRAQIRIVVRDVTNVNSAIRQVLEQAAQEWACDPDTLTVYGIAEGDITISPSDPLLDLVGGEIFAGAGN
jgi:hypothetical protein